MSLVADIGSDIATSTVVMMDSVVAVAFAEAAVTVTLNVPAAVLVTFSLTSSDAPAASVIVALSSDAVLAESLFSHESA